MTIEELAGKPSDTLTQEEKTFLTSLGCAHCYYNNNNIDCSNLSYSCWFGVWKNLQTYKD